MNHQGCLKVQLSALIAILATLLILIFVPIGFSNFLLGLSGKSNVIIATFSMTLLISVIGTSFVLLHKLGLQFDFKDEPAVEDSETKLN